MGTRGAPAAPPAKRPRRLRRPVVPLALAATATAGVLLASMVYTSHNDPAPHGTAAMPGNVALLAMRQALGSDQVAIYLCSRGRVWPGNNCAHRDATPAQRAAIVRDLKRLSQVLTSTYISQQQAYEDAKRRFARSPFIYSLDIDGFSAWFRVTVRGPADVQTIVQAFTGRPGVDGVVAGTPGSPASHGSPTR